MVRMRPVRLRGPKLTRTMVCAAVLGLESEPPWFFISLERENAHV